MAEYRSSKPRSIRANSLYTTVAAGHILYSSCTTERIEVYSVRRRERTELARKRLGDASTHTSKSRSGKQRYESSRPILQRVRQLDAALAAVAPGTAGRDEGGRSSA